MMYVTANISRDETTNLIVNKHTRCAMTLYYPPHGFRFSRHIVHELVYKISQITLDWIESFATPFTRLLSGLPIALQCSDEYLTVMR